MVAVQAVGIGKQKSSHQIQPSNPAIKSSRERGRQLIMTNSNPKPAHKPANVNPSQPSQRTLPADWVETTATDLFNALNEDDQQQDLRHPVQQRAISPTVSIAENAASKLVYPWNPTTDASDQFFNAVDNGDLLNSFTNSELDAKATIFFNSLDQLWDQSLQAALARKFATVPAAMLAQIAAQATQMVQTSNDLLDQLTTCVQSVLPEWALEDLQVLARPMAYAMRGESAELTTNDWATLSATEQAKLTLAIADYALKQLQD
jgi:hypothetical protein